MNSQDYQNKVNELNLRYSNLNAELITSFGGVLEIKVCNSDKAKTLREMFQKFRFTF